MVGLATYMEKLESKSVAVRGIKLRYLYGGRGPKLCFIQGWGTFDTYLSLLRELSTHFTVYAPDVYWLRNKLKLPF
jgi:hypothetical protein